MKSFLRIGYREILFSANSYAAALLALFLSFACDLERPYWAMMTAYITSQPFTGAVRSKAIYRLAGTMLGAAMMVFVIPPLSNAPPLLSLVIALWVGICLFFSLLDRTPRAYVFLLAGYTTAFIGIPIVSQPDTAFNVAIARLEEISVGILCSTFFHTVFFPRSLRQMLAQQFGETVRDLKTWLSDTLARKKDAVHRRGRIRLAADITDLHLAATHIPFDTHEPQEIRGTINTIENRLIQMFPIITGLSDRLKRLEQNGPVPLRVKALLHDVSVWLATDGNATYPTAGALQKKCQALRTFRGPPGWKDLLVYNIATRLSELIDVYTDCREKVSRFARNVPDTVTTQSAPTDKRILHTDGFAALYSAISCTCITFIGALIWIASPRPEGATAVMMGTVTYCLFASQANPVPAQKTSLYYTALASLVAGIYLFAIIPHVHSFLTLALVLAPTLLTAGALLAIPRIGMQFMSFVIPFCGSLTLTRHFAPNFEDFLNFNVAQFVGIAAVVAVTRILHRFSARKRISSVLRATWADIAALASGSHKLSSTAWQSLMVDRIGLLAPYADIIKSSEHLKNINAMSELRTGLSVIRLARTAPRLSPELAEGIRDMFAQLSEHFSQQAETGIFCTPPEMLLRQIDLQIATLSSLPDNRLKGTIMNALTGIRCNLFPQAPAYMYGIDWHD